VTISVFFSWQSDRPRRVTRDVITSALTSAVTALPPSLTAELTEPVRIDSDTRGIPGTPPIAATIFRKIEAAGVFVADVTFIAAVSGTEKQLPNPNVLFELAWAARSLGWDRVILVSNTAFGSLELLPFDLRNHRFPTAFDLPPNASRDMIQRTEKQLGARLTEYIANALAARLVAAEEALEQLDLYAIELLMFNADNDPPIWGVNLTFGSLATANGFDLAVTRLLQLRLAKIAHHPEKRSSLWYSWTHLGYQVIRLLKERGVTSLREK
jgi:hypothetical protein